MGRVANQNSAVLEMPEVYFPVLVNRYTRIHAFSRRNRKLIVKKTTGQNRK